MSVKEILLLIPFWKMRIKICQFVNDTARKTDVETIPEWAKWVPCRYIHDKNNLIS